MINQNYDNKLIGYHDHKGLSYDSYIYGYDSYISDQEVTRHWSETFQGLQRFHWVIEWYQWSL